ncbi:MAG TPA: hypothetical protein VHR18_02905 [Solirubrobacterales bacterium]|nr:hypothetical protein [Solirubrobacterales bacterium]
MRIGGRDRLRVQGAVEQGDAVGDEDVGGVLGLGRGVEPGLGLLDRREGREGADRGGAGERQRFRLGAGIGSSRSPASPGGGRRSAERLYDEDALGAVLELVTGQVAAVRKRQRAGEIELRESE